MMRWSAAFDASRIGNKLIGVLVISPPAPVTGVKSRHVSPVQIETLSFFNFQASGFLWARLDSVAWILRRLQI
jgi:hypothetical protein